MTGRVSCSVEGCKATTGRFKVWICSRHWGRLTKDERRAWRRALRRWKAAYALWLAEPSHPGRRLDVNACARRADVIWRGLVRRASL